MEDTSQYPVIEVAKSPSGAAPKDNGAPSGEAMMSTYNQEGTVSQDSTSTREVVSPTTIPLDYQYNEEEMTANMALAISSDVEDVKEADLLKDETFGYASKKMFRSMRGEDFTGTDEEATRYGVDLMRKVDNILYSPSKENLYGFVSQVEKMSQEEAQSALYMMEMFEAKEYTMKGLGEAMMYMGTDVANYVGLSTFGWGFAGKQGAKYAAKKTMMEILKRVAFSNAGIGAVEGGAWTGAYEHGKQSVSEMGGQGYDADAVAMSTAVGAGFGLVAGKYLPEVFEYAGEKMGKWLAKDGTVDVAKVKLDADAGDTDAAAVLEDVGMLEGYFGRKLNEFEQTPMGQMVTGLRYMSDNAKVKYQKKIDTLEKQLEGKELTPEQQKLAEVYLGKSNVAEIKTADIETLKDELFLTKGNEKKGAKHIMFKHFGEDTNSLTADEIVGMMDIIRKSDVEDITETRRVYTSNADDGSRIRVVIDENKKKGSDFVVSYYSNRKEPVVGHSDTYNKASDTNSKSVNDTSIAQKEGKNQDGVRHSVDDLIASTKDLSPKAKKQRLSAAFRDATPDEKEKLKAAMAEGAPAPKPKTPKQVEKIAEQEDFNSQFYSKLEHEVNKIPDDMQFENSQAAVDYLLKQGVKKDELSAAGVNGRSLVPTNGKVMKNSMSQRPDKIQKRVYTEEDFGGSDGNMNREDWADEWTTEYEGEEVNVGESGMGVKIVDDYTGIEGEIGYSCDYDSYVDDSGAEYTFDKMKSEYLDNYADEYIEKAKAARPEMLPDENGHYSGEENDEMLEAAWQLADDDGAWNEHFYYKDIFELEDGQRFDDLDEAKEALLGNLYDDYIGMAERNEGNSFEGYTVNGGEDYRMEVYQMEDFTSSKNLHEEPHLGEDYSNEMEFGNENVQVHARVKTRRDADGKKGDVLEEVQSQWEQDWRGQGGDTPPSEKVVKAAENTITENKKTFETNKVEISKLEEKINDEKVLFSDLNQQADYTSKETDLAQTDEAAFIAQTEEIMKKQNDSVLRKTELERDRLELQRENRKLDDESQKLDKDVINWTEAGLATPPIQDRPKYEKIVLLDNVLNSIQDGKDYFGWINGHIQNGSATPESQLTGMTQAYDKEMPRIIQKATGETPYMASFEDGMPVKIAGDDEATRKVYWDSKTANEDMEHFDNMTNDNWYWRIDLTNQLKEKLKDAKIQMYGVGGAALVGADGASLEGEDNAEQ